MPNFSYIAKTAGGETKKGKAPADDLRHLAQNLKDEGLVLIKGVSKNEKKLWSSLNIRIPGFGGVPIKEKIIMTRNLAVMTSTGMSLVKIFDILIAQAKSPKFKSALADIKERVNKGESLSDALSKHRDIFSNIFLSMVKIGEESGTLEEVFNSLSVQLEKEHDLKSKIKNAMIYPIILLLVMIAAAILVITFVMPKLDTFFTSFKAPIPFYTRLMLDAGKFASNQWALFIICPAVFVFLLWIVSKTGPGKRAIDTILLKLPLFSTLVKESSCALLIRSLSSLIAAGVPLVRSLEVSADTMGNFYFNKAVKDAALRVKKGDSLSNALSVHKNIFPFGTIEMFTVGEETGKTSEILNKLAEFYENEVSELTSQLSTVIEPVLIVLMGAGVGIFAVAVVAPMYSMLGSIR